MANDSDRNLKMNKKKMIGIQITTFDRAVHQMIYYQVTQYTPRQSHTFVSVK